MDTQPKNNLYIPLVLIVAGVVGCYFSYQTGFNKAKSLVEASVIGGALQTQEDVRILSGTVTAISDDGFTLHTSTINPFDKNAIADRTVRITAETKIEKITHTDFAQQSKSVPRVIKTTVPAASIVVGDTVTVIASENVKMITEFSATSVQILPKAPVAQTPLAQ